MENPELARLLSLEDWNPNDEKIALDLEEDERVYLAKHIQRYDGILIDLSHDCIVAVRGAVASNKNTPINILKKLSINDESVTVRNIANSTLKELGNE
jgi:hypothetical protein